MRAVIFERPGLARVADLPETEPGPGEASLLVEAAGLCGSDVHAFEGTFPAGFPFMPGHEVAGVVERVGAGVDPDLVGARVVVHPLVPCGRCTNCRAERMNFCRGLQIYGGGLPGGFAERMAVRVDRLLPVPDGLSPSEAAFAEPLACVLHGLARIRVEPGDRVLIVGAGSIGLLMLQACRALGAAEVLMADRIPAKLELASSLGAVALEDGLPAEAACDLVIDATGNPEIAAGLLSWVRDAGRVLLFGVCPPEARIPFSPFEIYRRELTLAGCFSLTDELGAAIRMLEEGSVTAGPLVTERVGLDGLVAVLAREAHSGDGIKTMVEPGRGPRG